MRPILENFQGKNIPVEYAKQEAEAKQKFLEEWRKSGKAKVAGGLTLSGLFGGPGTVSVSSSLRLYHLGSLAHPRTHARIYTTSLPLSYTLTYTHPLARIYVHAYSTFVFSVNPFWFASNVVWCGSV